MGDRKQEMTAFLSYTKVNTKVNIDSSISQRVKHFQQVSQLIPLRTSRAVEMHLPSVSDQNNKHPA